MRFRPMRINRYRGKAVLCGESLLTIATLVFLMAPARAQQDAAASGGVTVLEEIIVTAQKRAEDVQDIAAAVTVLGSEALTTQHATNVYALSGAAPNLNIGGAAITYVFIRGIGSNNITTNEGSVAMHSNGVYVAQQTTQFATFFDIDRVEILRGPQGDLYGRNATGGSINVISRRPTQEFAANARFTPGSDGLTEIEAGFGGPISDNVGARLATFYAKRDGFGANIVTGNEIDDRQEEGLRLTVDFTPTDDLTVELIGEYFNKDDNSNGWHYAGQANPIEFPAFPPFVGGVFPTDIRDVANESDPQQQLTTRAFTGVVDYQINDTWAFRSISGYREFDIDWRSELDGSSARLSPLTAQDTGRQRSHEFQFLAEGNRYDLIVGGYYFYNFLSDFLPIEYDGVFSIFAPGSGGLVFDTSTFTMVPALYLQDGSGTTNAYAVFANAGYDLSDTLRLVTGVRYSRERRSVEGTFSLPTFCGPAFPCEIHIPITGNDSWNAVTPKLGLEYQFAPDVMGYATASRGFRSGSFVVGVANPAVEPEYVWSYEVGLKSRLRNQRVQANVAAFYYDYKDLQVTRLSAGTPILENAAEATVKGLEVEVEALPGDNLRLGASLGYLDATYDRFVTEVPAVTAPTPVDLAGNRLSFSPEWSARLSVEYVVPTRGLSQFSFYTDVKYTDEQFFEPYNNSSGFQPSYTVWNARLTYDSGDLWSVALWGKNLNDETYRVNNVISAAFVNFPSLMLLGEPRTFGLDLIFSF